MRKWKRYTELLADGFDAECEYCHKPIVDMKLVLTDKYQLECTNMSTAEISYGGREDYDQRTELRCDCGRVYKEDEDYGIKWEEANDGDWAWTLEVEMEEGQDGS